MAALPQPQLVRKPEPEVSFHYAARIEPGEYTAYCRSADTYKDRRFQRWVCALQFDIVTDSLIEIAKLTCFLNLGRGEFPRAGRTSNYWQAWVKANGSQPSRNCKMSDRIFPRRYARVLVADTTKDFRQLSVDSDSCYSVVREILEWNTGSTIKQSTNQGGI